MKARENEMQKEFPTSRAQDTVLKALGLKAENYSQAERILEACGLKVTPVRQGRTSIPSVTLLDGVSGGWSNGDADYTTVTPKQIDLTPILEWIVAKDLPYAEKRIARAQSATTPAVDADALVAADNAAKDAEVTARVAEEQRRKDVREAAGRQRAALRTAGYTWRKIASSDDDEADEWALFAPDGRAVTEAEAMREITTMIHAQA